MENIDFDTEKYLLELEKKYRFKMLKSLIVYYVFTSLMIVSLIGYFTFSFLIEQEFVKYLTLIGTVTFLITGVFSFRSYNINKIHYDLNNFLLSMLK